MDKVIGRSVYLKYFIKFKASSLAAARVQHPAPNFQGQAVVDGDFKSIQLSDFKGKYLVLFFYPLDL